MAHRRLGHRLFMLGFIAAPFVVLAVLVQGIAISFVRGPSMSAEPVGAGAGDSGGANAVGESLFGAGGGREGAFRGIPAEQTARGAVLVVRDASGVAGEGRPVLVLTNHGRWEVSAALTMTHRDDALWEVRLPAPTAAEPEPLAFRFAVLGDDGRPRWASDEAGEPVGERRLPRVSEAEALGDRPLVYEFVVGFGG
jgi:hypothetical protein